MKTRNIFSKKSNSASPLRCGCAKVRDLKKKIRGNFIFVLKVLVDRLSVCLCSQLANGIAVPLRGALGVCTGSKRPVLFLARSVVRSRSRKLEMVRLSRYCVFFRLFFS